MRPPIERLLAAALAGAVVIAGCSGGGSSIEPIGGDDQGATAPDGEVDAPEPDEPEQPGEPEDVEPDDPFAVPDEIDVDYAQRVFDELFRLEAEVYNDVLETGVPDDGLIPLEQLEPLRDITGDPSTFERLVSQLEGSAAEGFERQRQPLQPRSFVVEELPVADEGCIFAEGDVDLTATAIDPAVERLPHQYVLVRGDDNVTGWVFWTFTAVTDEFEGFDPQEECP